MCEILPKTRKICLKLGYTLKILQLLGTSTGAPPLVPAGGIPSPRPPVVLPPAHPKPPSAAYAVTNKSTQSFAYIHTYTLNFRYLVQTY